jgi:DNA-directed RNA polymerase subunit RPC12/RpoP
MAKPNEAGARSRAGRAIKCPICGDDRFWTRKGQLQTRLLSFLDLDWTGPTADCYVCATCRHILWFYPETAKL